MCVQHGEALDLSPRVGGGSLLLSFSSAFIAQPGVINFSRCHVWQIALLPPARTNLCRKLHTAKRRRRRELLPSFRGARTFAWCINFSLREKKHRLGSQNVHPERLFWGLRAASLFPEETSVTRRDPSTSRLDYCFCT